MVYLVSHIAVSFAVAKILRFNDANLTMFVAANAVDIDHIFDGEPCSDTDGNTFEENFFIKTGYLQSWQEV